MFIYQINIGIYQAYASPWTTKKGQYKIVTSYGVVDKKSKKRKSEHHVICQKIQDELDILYQVRYRLQNNLDSKKKPTATKQKNLLLRLNHAIKELEQIRDDLSSIAQYHFGNTTIEYGASKKHNIGVTLHYKHEKFRLPNNRLYHPRTYSTDLYYKYSPYSSHNYCMTLQPKLKLEEAYIKRHRKRHNAFIEGGVLFGHKRRNKKYSRNTFTEMSLYVNRCINKYCHNQTGYGVTISDGVQFDNGIYISNFIKYEYCTKKSNLYKSVLYEQIAVAKDVKFKSFHDAAITFQIGYFWQRSLYDKSLKISGPVFALWTNI